MIGHISGLVLAFIALTTLGIWGLIITTNGSLKDQTRSEILASIDQYNDSDHNSIYVREIDWLQTRFQCCGLNSSEDWANRNFTENVAIELNDKTRSDFINRNQSLYDVPDSCCLNATKGCGLQFPMIEQINQNGCFEPFFRFLSNDMKIICGIACALSSLSLISIAFLIYVCFALDANYELLNTNMN